MEERGNARGFAVEDNAWRGCINGSVREYIGHLVWVETVKYLGNIYETGWQRFSLCVSKFTFKCFQCVKI